MLSETKYREKLERLGKQLSQTEAVLQSHPLVNEKLMILQTVVRFFCLQTEWSVAGPLARLSMTLETALLGDIAGQSQAAFIGPAVHQMQQGFKKLLETVFDPSEKKWVHLVSMFTEVKTMALIYVSTQLLGNWKKIFDFDDPGGVKQAGLLLRELGLTYILSGNLLESPYKILGKQLGLDEKKQKRLGHLGLAYLLLIMVLVNEEDEPLNEDLFELIAKHLKPALQSLEECSVDFSLRSNDDRSVDFSLRSNDDLALSQLELIKQSLEDPLALKQAIMGSFEVFGLPYNEVRKDLRSLIEVHKNLFESFKNIFYQKEQTVTSMRQSA
jgi:hypothetical protein